MPTRKSITTRKKKQEFFNLADVLDGVEQGYYLRATTSIDGVDEGDLILFDRARTKPKDGDLVSWGTDSDVTIAYYFKDNPEREEPLWGIAVALIRRYNHKTRKRQKSVAAPVPDRELSRLRTQLDRLERLPENEAIQLQLESEIYRLESQTDEEWPEFVGA